MMFVFTQITGYSAVEGEIKSLTLVRRMDVLSFYAAKLVIGYSHLYLAARLIYIPHLWYAA